ncbi:MAG TPA: hypothetical protein VGD74_07775, partial [Vulgatibacter sp.]
MSPRLLQRSRLSFVEIAIACALAAAMPAAADPAMAKSALLSKDDPGTQPPAGHSSPGAEQRAENSSPGAQPPTEHSSRAQPPAGHSQPGVEKPAGQSATGDAAPATGGVRLGEIEVRGEAPEASSVDTIGEAPTSFGTVIRSEDFAGERPGAVELLLQSPGTRIRRAPGGSTLSLRGSSPEHTLVLLD